MSKTSSPAPLADLSFEAAMLELENIVRELDSGKAGLEGSIQLYERGVQLRNHCAARLQDAQLRIEKLSLDGNGQPSTQPTEI